MSKFRFPLEHALRWRRHQLEVEELETGRLMSQLNRLDEVRHQLIGQRERAETVILDTEVVLGVELERLAAFQRHSRARQRALAVERRQCEAQLLAQRERFVEARRRVRLLERLRERRFDAWGYDEARREENQLAEIYLARWPNVEKLT